ncbi:MAG TPA: AMP-binding protein [Nocardioides sp.]|jgi:acyl-CoA synthetase (AMP-forming)/AMP-acid ligase II|uniref:AMP-binding protein n=1 Tax=Nocardioides sp. TaxID=35761 RepID=UPI002E34AA67|nr:AMP-binding protein [Nocardioides sp.]HEX3932817.1 AMP-binding protein [Nocardioides sp.]
MIVPFSVTDFLDRAVAVYADRLGIADEPDQPAASLGDLTYGRVCELAAAMAAKHDALGLEVGDRVAFVSHNSARLFTSFFGVCGYGRVLVPVNFRLSFDEVQYIVEHSGARVVYVDPELRDTLSALKAEHVFVLGDDDDLYLHDTAPRAWEPDENATATINYTSGTTARPKGVQITHRNIWTNAVTFALHAGVSDRDVYLHTLPMFHANGWGMPFAMTGCGVPQVSLRKVDGTEILRRIEKHGVTVMCAAPAVVAAVLEAAPSWEGPIPGSGGAGRARTRIIVAGAPPPTKTVARVEAELGWEFIQIYGLTETSPLLTVNRTRSEWDDLEPEERAHRLVRAGTPAIGVSLRIDAEGEVLARSNVCLEGYWQQPEESERALAEGWFHTGDGGFLDDDGYLVIADRKKDVIITGGENVSSIEVEDAIFSHPEVAEVAVIGVPDDRWGETIKALVVKAEGSELTEEQLIDYVKGRVARYKAPTSVEFREILARTATGKLQKFKLRAPYWEGRDRQVN